MCLRCCGMALRTELIRILPKQLSRRTSSGIGRGVRQEGAIQKMHQKVDLVAYFERIGYVGSADPTPNTLARIVAAHTQRIPFENLDSLLGIPVADLGP